MYLWRFLKGIILIGLLNSHTIIGAGIDNINFSVEIESDFSIDGAEFKQGNYIFIVDNFDKCKINIYDIGIEYRKNIFGETEIASKELLGFYGDCFLLSHLEKKYSIEIFQDQQSETAVILFKTPDYKLKKTRLIIIKVKIRKFENSLNTQ